MRFVMLAVVATMGCAQGDPPRHDEPTGLRISTSSGVAPITPATRGTFSVNILDLVYDVGSKHFSSLTHEGTRVLLKRRADSRFDAAELARRLKHAHLRAASVSGDDVVAELSDENEIELNLFFIDAGPFEASMAAPDHLQLHRRAGHGIASIDVISMPTDEEEWRRFLAREVDLVTDVSPSHLKYLREVPSVKIVLMRHPNTVALWFNTRTVPPEMRRAISDSLRRGAIAQAATDDSAAAVPVTELNQGDAPRPPNGLRLLVPDGVADFPRAALLVESQLAERNVSVHTTSLPIPELQKALTAGDFDLLIFYGAWSIRYAPALESHQGTNMTGYQSDEFEQAVAAGDEARVARILEHDLPLTPLYTLHEGVALDERFCGANPDTSSDYTWLADVHLCAPGEK